MRNREKGIREPGATMASEKKLLEFARSYLSEAFPNPERAGCPPESALELLASRPREADATISEHLTCCSPCFNRYMELLAQVEQERESSFKRVFSWAIASPLRAATIAGLALGIGIGTYVLVGRLQTPPPPPLPGVTEPLEPVEVKPSPPGYAEFALDLSGLSPVRGEEVAPPTETVVIPQRPLDLTLYLPLGSEEGTYRVMLRARDTAAWSGRSNARLHERRMTLQVKADLSGILPGRYFLVVESPSGVVLKKPVSIHESEQSEP